MPDHWGGWDQLNTLTLQDGSTAASIDTMTAPVHVQRENKETLSDIVLVNAASMRDGAPIPGSGAVTGVRVTTETKTTILRPEKGEVLQVMGIDATRAGGSGAVTYSLYLTGESDSVFWFYLSTTDSGVIFSGDSNYFAAPLYLTENLYLQATPGGDFTTVDFRVASVRVR